MDAPTPSCSTAPAPRPLPLPESLPPIYSPSPNTPSYSLNPLPNEQRLASNTCPAQRSAATNTFEYRSSRDGITLKLSRQEEGVHVPCYGRDALIAGHVLVANSENVKRVDIKLQARLRLSIVQGGTTTESLLARTHTVWTRNENGDESCPLEIPFEIALPSTYMEYSRCVPLPPTYHFTSTSIASISVCSVYTISVVVVSTRRRLCWRTSKKLTIPFTYRPRTCSRQPIIRTSLPFPTALKTAPEEFHQIESMMETRDNSGVEPIHCQLFIPSALVYALTETIPFHLQLTGTRSSFLALFPGEQLHPPFATTVYGETATGPPTVRVYLLRQVIVVVGDQKAWSTYVMGEGELTRRDLPAYPTTDDAGSETSALRKLGEMQSMDWDGTVRVAEGETVGGFCTDNLAVKDFIILSITPFDHPKSPFFEHQWAYPIRLVTDQVEEIWEAQSELSHDLTSAHQRLF